MFLVESPAPYAGDIMGATATIGQYDGDNKLEAQFDVNSLSFDSLVRVGDYIRFDGKGIWYRIKSKNNVSAANVWVDLEPRKGEAHPGTDGKWGQANVDDDSVNGVDDIGEAYWNGSDDGPTPPLPTGSTSWDVTYQVFRQPIRSISQSLQLSGGVCVDLLYSGHGNSGTQFAATGAPALDPIGVSILFSPTGAVSRCITGVATTTMTGTTFAPTDLPPSGTVYLLVGRSEQVPRADSSTSSELLNVEDTNATWVAISHRTGAVVPGEVDREAYLAAAANLKVSESRKIATSGEALGGR
jgi:hypothetical protein